MTTDTHIVEAQNRAIGIYTRRPSAALNTAETSAEIVEGLRCTVSEGAREAILDMPEILGGGGAGPTPGFHARAAVAGCLAMGMKMTALRLSIPVSGVRIGLEMDFDDRGMFGLGFASAAPLETRVTIYLDSPAPEAEIDRLVHAALESDTYFLALRDAQTVTTSVERV